MKDSRIRIASAALAATLAVAVAGSLPAHAAAGVTIWAAGANDRGQFGDGTLAGRKSFGPAGAMDVVAMDSAGHASVAVDSDGIVRVWGEGALGLGALLEMRTTPVAVPGLPPATAACAGQGHMAAVLADGTVRAWGTAGTSSVIPAAVAGLSDVRDVACGRAFVLALLRDGTVRAWGVNDRGQLGDGTKIDRYPPVAVQSLSGVEAIGAGDAVSYAIIEGEVFAWGAGRARANGEPSGADLTSPQQIDGLLGVVAVDGGVDHGLALDVAGSVWSWGSDEFGSLGRGSGGIRTAQPGRVLGVAGIASIAAGFFHNIAVSRDGSAWAWGWNADGQLGEDGFSSTIARRVPGVATATIPAAGLHHSLLVVCLGSDLPSLDTLACMIR